VELFLEVESRSKGGKKERRFVKGEEVVSDWRRFMRKH